jgi:enoyl-CoA hydratase/carnithine racemase
MNKLQISHDGAVMTLTLHRPAVRNALDRETYLALIQALAAAEAQADVAVIVVHGAEGHFCAGNDLHDFRQPRDPGESAGIRFLRQLAATTKPIVAAVEGSAVGIGVTLLLHVDFVYADPSAMFRLPFVPLGLCPEGASSLLLPRLVGARKATDWILTGRAFDAREAFESGLVTALTAPGESLASAQRIARELAAQPTDALRLAKNMLARADRAMIDETLGYEAQRFAERLHTTEAQQAFARFFARGAKG